MDNNLCGKIINNRYMVQDLIGTGGMAVVYKAVDVTNNRIVAVKVLKQEYLSDPQFRHRFETESKVVEMMSHPNIVKIHNVGLNDDLYYIVMEYIDGISLKQYIEQQGHLTWRESIYFIIQILSALDHAHKRGIIHRDIKPQNIMLIADGSIKVTDFGIARFANRNTATMTDKAIGSVHYISPEQVSGERTDTRGDIYSVGIMMFEMLTGKVPFDAENPVSVALMQLQNTPPKPRSIVSDIPEGLEEIILKAIAKNPDNRYASAEDFLEDIEKFKQNPSILFEYTYFQDEKPKKYVDAIKFLRSSQDGKPRKSAGAAIAGIASAFLVVTALILFVVIPIFFSKGVQDIKVPDLVGRNLDEVLSDETFSDFRIVPVAQNNNAQYPKGVIYDQTPHAGMTVKPGADLRVSVSLGEKTVIVPPLANVDYRDAQIQLNGLELKYEVIEEFSETVLSGLITRTEPDAGTEVSADTVVKLYTSKGKQNLKAVVPNVIGMSIEEAKQVLIAAKFVCTTKTVVSEKKLGFVVAQGVTAGSAVDEGSVIDLSVSDGSLAPKSKTITINFPTDKATFEVKVLQNNKQVYKDIHTAEEQYIKLELFGEGEQWVEVYIDNVLYNSFQVSFN